MKDSVFAYIKKNYKTSPEYLWKRFPEYAVFRHSDNSKWFALQASVPGEKLGLGGHDLIEFVNVKVDDLFFRDMLIQQDGILPAYHMNKQHWVTVLLDGTVSEKQVLDLIDASFLATASAKKKQKIRPSKEWIIPSNPRYYDIIHAFDEYGIYAVRGPRGITNSLSEALKNSR